MKYVYKSRAAVRYRFPHHSTDLVIDRSKSTCSEVFIASMRRDSGNPLHRHTDTEQVFYVLEGRGVLTIGKGRRELPLTRGDVVRIPPGTWHSVRAHRSPRIRYLCVDCFGGNVPADERTWDDHIRAVCAREGWNFAALRRRRGNRRAHRDETN